MLLESLVSPIPRSVFDSVVAFGDISSLLDLMQLRKTQRDMAKSGSFLKSAYNVDMHPSLKSVSKTHYFLSTKNIASVTLFVYKKFVYIHCLYCLIRMQCPLSPPPSYVKAVDIKFVFKTAIL